MALSVADKRWLRKAVREELESIVAEALSHDAKQLGGYDGAVEATDADEWYDQRKPIGFHVPQRQAGDSTT